MLSRLIYVFSAIVSVFLAHRIGQQGQLYSDTIFVRPNSYENDNDNEVINHLEQYCVYEPSFVSAEPSAYLRSCQIREGAYQQECYGDGYSTATCFKPEIIKDSKPKTCQSEFIHERFSKKEKPTTFFFLNCEKGKYPKKYPRDSRVVSKHISPEGISYSDSPAENFKLTRR